ncbi:MAG: hypothetical protein HYS35_09115, partial [Betaproteobacteria bacterium]|nr:hypothetical protein [Betaproteobacteria bacterium]
AKDVAQRYQTARDLGFALKRALDGLPEIDEAERTVVLAPGALGALGAPAPRSAADADATVAMPGGAAAPRTQAVELEFWRSIKDGNDPADFDLYVQQFPSGIYAALAKRKSAKLRGVATEDGESKAKQEQERREIEEAARREAEAKAKLAAEKAELEARLAKREAEMARRELELSELKAEGARKLPLVPVLAALALAAAAGGAWYALKPPDPLNERVAELTRLLEESKRRETELVQSKQREAELAKELELARQRVAEAEKGGDLARQRELAEQVRQREAEAARQAELTRQRAEALRRQAEAAERARQQVEAAARKTPPAAKKAEPAKQVETARAPEPAKAPEPVKAEAPKAPEAKAPEPVKLAAASAAPLPSPAPEPAPMTVEAMLQRAIALEAEGKNKEASRLLSRAVREGKGHAAGQAAKRLGDMLQKGVPGVQRDYGEALRYYEIARLNGVEVPVARSR